MKLNMCIAMMAVGLFAQIAYPISHAYKTSGSDWDTRFHDTALGSQYITSRANVRNAPDSLNHSRAAGYRVSFDTAGTYDLYMRAKASRRNASIAYNSNFGTNVNWQGVTGRSLQEDAFGWVKISDGDFTVDAPDTLHFSIASNRRGIHIDAFAFGTTGTSFSDEELDAAVLGKANQSGLIGFQAQYANILGQDTLSDRGVELQKNFTERMFGLRAALQQQLPAIDQAKVAAWHASIEAEEPFAKEAASKAQAVARMRGAAGRLARSEEDQLLIPATLADAQARVVRARAMGADDPAREEAIRNAESFLAGRQRDVNRAERGLEQARRAVEEAKQKLPAAIKQAEAAQEAHQRAMAATWQVMDALGASDMLGSDGLDDMLAQYMVLHSAPPRELAKFAEQDPENLNLINELLGDTGLMVQMLVADGPNAGKFGDAMKIYTDIQQASPKAQEDGIFQRLALAVSLGHAGGISERDQPAVADPVQRYLHFEQAYLDGELDISFPHLCVWSLVMVVSGRDCDETMAWGRALLNNLRPAFIPANGDTSVFVDFVGAEIVYTSAGPGRDRSDVRFMQNILANGGICGRRAFFGRFILRAFGVPTTARLEPGHATLAHWHPDGWQTKLGGSWGPDRRGRFATMNRERSRPYGIDLNFLATTQARLDGDAFIRVKRAQWIGAVAGEEPKPGLVTRGGNSSDEELSFWNDLALHEQRRIIARLDAARGESSVVPAEGPAPAATGTVTVDANGVITIPAAATSSPTESTRRLFHGHRPDILLFVRDRAGDTRLYVSRLSNENDTFTYTFDAPRAGIYEMVACVATPRWDQSLYASANGSDFVEMPLPYTTGLWETSAPIEIELAAGRNEVTFHGGSVVIDQFTLTPVR